MLRNTKAPAILLEVGFIDNTLDNQLFDLKFNEITDAIVTSIAQLNKTKSTCPTCGRSI